MKAPFLAWAAVTALVTACSSSSSSGEGTSPESAPPPLAPTRACTDAIDAVYATPDGLSPFSESVRGQIVSCAPVQTISEADVRQRMMAVPGTTVASGDVHVFLISYRTERDPAAGALSSALVYLPSKTLAERVPLVVAAHGTVGLSDDCAPSRMILNGTSFLPASYWDALNLAWAARGLPVIAPDYAGLGTDGVHGYDDWLDSARSALDGARALASFVPAAIQDGDTIVSGHSQGGGVALSAAAYASEAPDVHLGAIVALAPGYRLTALSDALGFAGAKVSPLLRAVAATTLVADYASLTTDTSHYGDPFAPAIRDYTVQATTTKCFFDLMSTLDTPADGYVPPTTIGDFTDPDFRMQALACSSGNGSCDGLVGAWVMRDRGNEPHLSSASPPVLVVSSTDDEQALPQYVGCAIDRITQEGAPPDLCIWEGQMHIPIVAASASYAIDWALAAASGKPRPMCTQPGQRAACSIF